MEEIQRTNQCPLCKSTNLKFISTGVAPFIEHYVFKSQQRIDARYQGCQDCGFCFYDIRYTEQQMSSLYSDYRSEQYTKIRETFERGYSEINKKLTDENLCPVPRREYVHKFLSKNIDLTSIKTLLDYGGDRGQFIPESLLQAECFVYEVSNVSTIDGVKKLNDYELQKHAFDIVLCMHVLEHSPQPQKILDKIKSVMRIFSWLYIELPIDNIGAMHEHINGFNPNALSQWLLRNGFATVDMWHGVVNNGWITAPIIQCLSKKIGE